MEAKQRCRPTLGVHRCVVLYSCLGFACLVFSGHLRAKQGEELEDFAEVYIDQYFEPNKDLLLSEAGKQKSRALAYYSRGRTYESKGRINDAIEAYKEVLAAQPDRHFLARKTAYLMARAGSNAEALKLLEENLEANSEVPLHRPVRVSRNLPGKQSHRAGPGAGNY